MAIRALNALWRLFLRRLHGPAVIAELYCAPYHGPWCAGPLCHSRAAFVGLVVAIVDTQEVILRRRWYCHQCAADFCLAYGAPFSPVTWPSSEDPRPW